MENHAQRRRHQAGRGRPVPAHRVGPALDREALEEAEGTPVVHALEDPEEATEVHEGRVDDGNAVAEPDRLVPVGL